MPAEMIIVNDAQHEQHEGENSLIPPCMRGNLGQQQQQLQQSFTFLRDKLLYLTRLSQLKKYVYLYPLGLRKRRICGFSINYYPI